MVVEEEGELSVSQAAVVVRFGRPNFLRGPSLH